MFTKKKINKLLETIEETQEEIKEENKEQEYTYPYAEWERKRKQVKRRLKQLPKLVEEAADQVNLVRSKQGRPPKLDLKEKTMLFLYARMEDKTNRDMETMLAFLGPLFDADVSYKTIERLYSDKEVKLVLHNLFRLLLQERKVSGNLTGDGTGYSLTVKRHYNSKDSEDKSATDYIHVFNLLDIETGMYIAHGSSQQSEKEAYNQAMEFIENNDIEIQTLRLDKYYSNKKTIRNLPDSAKLFLIPKTDLAKAGMQWPSILKRIEQNPYKYLKQYYQRERSETSNNSDKNRFGRKIRQKREKRRETATFATALLHNIFTTSIPPP